MILNNLMMKQIILSFCFLSLWNFDLFSQPSFQPETIQNKDGKTIVFRKLDPSKLKKKKKYPLVIFLHGSGERGSDNTKQLVHGSAMFLTKKNRKDYPAFVVFPQCPEESYWATRDKSKENGQEKYVFDYSLQPSFSLKSVFDIVTHYKMMPNVDSNRIYIMGLSMGGMGTLEAISRHPEMFAAAIPICGGGDLGYVSNFATKVPVWLFHGAQDEEVFPKFSRDMVDKIIANGGFPKYTEFPYANHNSWDATFQTKDLFKWLFEQKRVQQTNY